MRRGLLSQVFVNHKGCAVDTMTKALEVNERMARASAILFVSKDAKQFMASHRITFLDTLAVCLKSSTDEIVILDMYQKPCHLQ